MENTILISKLRSQRFLFIVFGLIILCSLLISNVLVRMNQQTPRDILFSRGGELFVINADGSGEMRLTKAFPDYPHSLPVRLQVKIEELLGKQRSDYLDGSNQAAWSPNGGQIAFISMSSIYTMRYDGSDIRQLLDDTTFNCCPSWSPDGSQIAFLSTRSQDGYEDIFLMNPDGSNITRLTRQAITYSHSPLYFFPIWSPSGDQIAFPLNKQVHVINVDGSNLRKLTNMKTSASPRGWSPDGTKILFTSDYVLYTINIDNSKLCQLTDNEARYDYAPSWSPDGQRIAFVSRRDGNDEIYIMNSDGTEQVRLTFDPSLKGNPVWVTDSSTLLFESEKDGNYEIYIMEADGSDKTRITFDSADDWEPDWRP